MAASVSAASAAATHPPSRAPPPATKAAPRGKLLLLAADAVLFGMVGALWVFHAANAAAVWAGGEGSRAAAAAAREAARLALLTVGSFFPLAVPVLFWKIHRHRAKARKLGSGGVSGRSDGQRQQPRLASRGARARPRQRGRRGTVSLVDLTLCFCALIVLVVEKIQVLAPAKGSWFAEFCPGINVAARFVGSVIMCFSFLPRCFSQVRALQG